MNFRPTYIAATLLVGSGTLFAATRPLRLSPQPRPPAARAQGPRAAAQQPPPRLLREVRQRERFLGLLIRREDRLIGNRFTGLRLEARLNTALDRVNEVLARGETDPGPLRRLAGSLGVRLDGLRVRLGVNAARLVAGLDREVLALMRLSQRAAALVDLRRYELMVGRQSQQVAAFGLPAATPVRRAR